MRRGTAIVSDGVYELADDGQGPRLLWLEVVAPRPAGLVAGAARPVSRREHGAEWQGQYEGDHHAEQVRLEIEKWKQLAGG